MISDTDQAKPLDKTTVSRSVFFEENKYYHKFGVNGDDNHYFKCQKVNTEGCSSWLYPDAFGVELYISPGKGNAKIILLYGYPVFKDWKEIKITEFSQKMIIERHMELSKRSLAQANLAMKFLSAVYNFTASILFDSNDKKVITEKSPVGVIYQEKKWNKIKRRKGYIRADQLHDWSEGVCKSYWKGNQNNDSRAYTNQDYLFLLILTGFRREEGETLEWENVDLNQNILRVVNNMVTSDE